MELDLAFLRQWIGKTTEAEDLVTPRLLAEYHATLDPHLAEVPEGAVPLALHWCLTPPITAMAELGPDGHAAKGGFLPPIPLPRRMWAGGMIETRQPIRVGDRVRPPLEDPRYPGQAGTLRAALLRRGATRVFD